MSSYATNLAALIDRLHNRCSTAPCDDEQEIVSKAAILLGFECAIHYPDLWNALGAHAYESVAYRLLPDWDRLDTYRLSDGNYQVTVYPIGRHSQDGEAATLALALTEAALAHRLAMIHEEPRKNLLQFTPTGCLLNAYRRDLEKDSEDNMPGLRSTRQVAAFTGMKPDRARRDLWKLVDVGVADVYDGKGVSNGEGNLWCLKRQLVPGEKVKVIRAINAVDQEVQATFIGIVKSSVPPVQVEFEDGQTTGYLHQEIREIVG